MHASIFFCASKILFLLKKCIACFLVCEALACASKKLAQSCQTFENENIIHFKIGIDKNRCNESCVTTRYTADSLTILCGRKKKKKTQFLGISSYVFTVNKS